MLAGERQRLTDEEQPTFVPPMPLTSGAVPEGDAWARELKWDG
jgi:ATP-dependent DNA ligase